MRELAPGIIRPIPSPSLAASLDPISDQLLTISVVGAGGGVC